MSDKKYLYFFFNIFFLLGLYIQTRKVLKTEFLSQH